MLTTSIASSASEQGRLETPPSTTSTSSPSPSPSPTATARTGSAQSTPSHPSVSSSHEYNPLGDADVVLFSSISTDVSSLPSSSTFDSGSNYLSPTDASLEFEIDYTPESTESSLDAGGLNADSVPAREFYVHSSVLALASPLFKAAFSPSGPMSWLTAERVRAPTPHGSSSTPKTSRSRPRSTKYPMEVEFQQDKAEETHATSPSRFRSLTRIPVTETPYTLSLLLRFIYPVPDPEIRTLDELVRVLAAAVRFDFAGVVSSVRKRLMSRMWLESEDGGAVRVFAIAARFGLEEEATLASRDTLGINLLSHPLCDDLKYISAHTYHRLLDLHRSRSTAAVALLTLAYSVKCPQCNTGHAVYSAPKWWYTFLPRAQAELRLRPCTNVVFSTKFLFDAAADAGCTGCAGSMVLSLGHLEEVKKRIDELPDTI